MSNEEATQSSMAGRAGPAAAPPVRLIPNAPVLNPASVTPGQNFTVTVSLNIAAPAGGKNINLDANPSTNPINGWVNTIPVAGGQLTSAAVPMQMDGTATPGTKITITASTTDGLGGASGACSTLTVI